MLIKSSKRKHTLPSLFRNPPQSPSPNAKPSNQNTKPISVLGPNKLEYRVRHHCKPGAISPKKAQEYFRQLIQTKPIPNIDTPDLYTFNILINCFFQTGKINCGFFVFGEIIKGDFKPDLITMSTLFNGLCLDGNFHVYGIRINGMCKIREIDSAIKLHRRMTCEADMVTYSAIIDGLCTDGSVDDAIKMFAEMIGKAMALLQTLERDKFELNIEVYSLVIDGLCRVGRWEEARKKLDQLSGKGLVPGVVTYSILINGPCKKGMIMEADKLL
ncbi:hypothetical protein CICLE_v10006746mg, partial [Citrus x clementina]